MDLQRSLRFRSLPVVALLAGALGLVSCSYSMNESRVTIDGQSFSNDRSGASYDYSDEGILPQGVRKLVLENYFGQIDVISAPETGWEWRLTCWAEEAELARVLSEEIRFEESTEGDTYHWRLVLPEPSDDLKGWRSDLTLRVPADVSVEAENRFGRIRIAEISGGATIDAGFAPVELTSLGGAAVVTTSFASVEVEDVGSLQVTNHHGSVTASSIRGDAVIHTSFAPVVLSGVRGRAEVRNQHGSVEAERIDGDLDAKSSFAAIDAQEIGGSATLVCQHGPVSGREIAGSVRAKTSFAPIYLSGSGARFDLENQHGSVRLEADSADLEEVIAKTSFASIDIALPVGLEPSVRARTSFGKVNTAFPVYQGGADLPAAAPGRPRLDLKTSHGSIDIGQ